MGSNRKDWRRVIAATPSAGLAAAVFLLAAATGALACPVCDTDTGLAVRAGIFQDGFWVTMLHALAPFPVLAAMVAAVHLGNRDLLADPRGCTGQRRDGAP